MEQLLTTKFHIPPARRELVLRPRLIEQLNDSLDCKLTLISAPAGFGKTTLVTEWVNDFNLAVDNEGHIPGRIAWLSLDEGDNDLARFLAYFIAALSRIPGMRTPIGEGALDSRPHAVTSIVGATTTLYCYDQNSNMTRRDPSGTAVYNFQYDAESRMVAVSGSATASFVFDGGDRNMDGDPQSDGLPVSDFEC